MSRQFYCDVMGQILGPLNTDDLIRMARAGEIKSTDKVREGDSGKWIEAGKVSGLFAEPQPTKQSTADPSAKVSAAMVVWSSTKAVGGGLARFGSSALAWNRARREELARRERELEEARLEEQSRPVPCPFCGEPIARQAKKCRHCNEYLDPNLRQSTQPQIVINNANTNRVQSHATAVATVGARRPKFSRFVAFVLSLLVPGLGQIYTGRLLAGVLWFIVVAIGYICFVVPGVVLHVLCAVSAAMTDPYR